MEGKDGSSDEETLEPKIPAQERSRNLRVRCNGDADTVVLYQDCDALLFFSVCHGGTISTFHVTTKVFEDPTPCFYRR